jgi:hypothetical protein
MPFELERFASSASLDRKAQKEIAQKQRDEQIARAESELRENVAACESSLRLANGAHLTNQAQSHINSLDAHTERTTGDKPALEMQHRDLQTAYTLAAGQLIYGYMTRPRRYS